LDLEITLSKSHLRGKNYAVNTLFPAVEAIHMVKLFVPPGTHYCWVARGDVYSKLAQGFNVLREAGDKKSLSASVRPCPCTRALYLQNLIDCAKLLPSLIRGESVLKIRFESHSTHLPNPWAMLSW
jgi:hypothetical protein